MGKPTTASAATKTKPTTTKKVVKKVGGKPKQQQQKAKKDKLNQGLTENTTATATTTNTENINNNKNGKQTSGKSNTASITDSLYTKKRVLVLSTRGITPKNRHLMGDLLSLIPHAKKEQKLDDRNSLSAVNDQCEMKGCNYAMLFDTRKEGDLFVWMSKSPLGPTIKFGVTNVHTLDELQMTGNCLKGSRPFLHFDANFDKQPHLKLTRELLTQVFSTPKGHVKSKPFFDHIFAFYYQDGTVWFRNYQISDHEFKDERLLTEIGPRMILHISKIFASSFSGDVLYDNPNFKSTRNNKLDMKLYKAYDHTKKQITKQKREKREKASFVDADEVDQLFD